MTIPECIRAMKSLINIISIVSRVDVFDHSFANHAIEAIQGHVAIVESSRLSLSANISVPFHACIVFMRSLEQLRVFASTPLFHQLCRLNF